MKIVDAHNNFIVTGDHSGEIIIWSFEAALGGEPAEVIRFSLQVNLDCDTWVRLGRDFVVWLDQRCSRVRVVDFL